MADYNINADSSISVFYVDQKTITICKCVTNVLQPILISLKKSRKLASVNQKQRFSPHIKLAPKRLIIFWSLVRAQVGALK